MNVTKKQLESIRNIVEEYGMSTNLIDEAIKTLSQSSNSEIIVGYNKLVKNYQDEPNIVNANAVINYYNANKDYFDDNYKSKIQPELKALSDSLKIYGQIEKHADIFNKNQDEDTDVALKALEKVISLYDELGYDNTDLISIKDSYEKEPSPIILDIYNKYIDMINESRDFTEQYDLLNKMKAFASQSYNLREHYNNYIYDNHEMIRKIKNALGL